MGKNFINDVLCDVIDMDVCHLIFGRPWQFHVAAMYDGRNNCYSFGWKGKHLKLVPITVMSEQGSIGDSAIPTKVAHSGPLATYREESVYL